jgi:hypothetical protein
VDAVLFEKPTLIAVLGAIIAIVLGFLWYQTARRELLYGLAIVLALTIVGLVIARVVVTEREAVDMVLHEAAKAVAHNDLDAVLQMIHPQAQQVRDQAEAELPRYDFHEVTIKSNLEITFDKLDQPTEAVARFNVMVSGSERNGLVKNRRVPRYCIVTFRKHENRWRLFSYEHDDPREGLLQR